MTTPDGAMDGVLTQLAELQHKVTGLETARENDRALIADLNTAIADSLSGATIKPVLTFGQV